MAFEEDLARLEDLVRRLEEGRLTLEESLAAFNEGMALAAGLSTQLKEAEQKILVAAGSQPVTLHPDPGIKGTDDGEP